MSPDRVSATRRIAAPASALFEIVSRPSGQVAIDGSGMLDSAPDDRVLTQVGETFDMDMDREPLGDIPNLKKYQVRNTVTRITPDRLIEWTIGFGDHPPFGHVYGWLLDPVTEAETDVTNYCDWSQASEEMRSGVTWPVVPVAMLEKSVANLERLATSYRQPSG
jgi:Polyketide cyclase / dehydrase and lipid transport